MGTHYGIEPHTFITIGSFDGIHKGHQKIISRLVLAAKKKQNKAVVVTFFPNPVVYLKNIRTPYYLTTLEEKKDLLSCLGVDQIETLDFNKSLSQTEPDQFIKDIHKQFHFACVIISQGFRFGRDRKGDIHTLKKLSSELSFSVVLQNPICENKLIISSSRIREYIQNGDVLKASELLGRRYSITGRVVHGDGRGKKIGLPTANIKTWHQKLLPGHGVYAVKVLIDGASRAGIVNIGLRPTFYENPVPQTTEVYILDWDEDIYGHELYVEFFKFLRSEIKFKDAAALMKQINEDIKQTRKLLIDG